MKDGKHVILIVDDDPDLIDSMRIFLEANGYLVVEAESAKEGLRAFNTENPDLIIVDLMMEEVDAGTSLIKDLKSAGCNVPIYMLSSVGDSFSISTPYTEMGLNGVFQKPFDFKSLLFILKDRLGE